MMKAPDESRRAGEGRFSLAGRVVVLTGGAGKLGRSHARALLDAGARVVLWDRVPCPDWATERIAEGATLRYQTVDITDEASVTAAAAALEREWGPADGLINNAGIDAPPASGASAAPPFEETPADRWREVLEVNTLGAMICSRVIGGAMASAGRGSIVMISSIYGVVGPDQRLYEFRRRAGDAFYKPAAYSVSKAALHGLTRHLAVYWAAKGVRVNTLVLAGAFDHQPPEFLEGYCARVPMGRMADPDEFAGGLIYLLSDASRYMTGATLTIDGGYTAW